MFIDFFKMFFWLFIFICLYIYTFKPILKQGSFNMSKISTGWKTTPPQSCMEEFLMLSGLKMRALFHGDLSV